MVDTLVLGTSVERRGSSNLPRGTIRCIVLEKSSVHLGNALSMSALSCKHQIRSSW